MKIMKKLRVALVGRSGSARCRVMVALLAVYLCLYVGQYFSFVTQHTTMTIYRHQAGTKCLRPSLELWNDKLRKVFSAPRPMTCSREEPNWVDVANGSLHISESAVKRHGSLNCSNEPIHRADYDDDKLVRGVAVNSVKHGARFTSDVTSVSCTAKDGASYSNILLAVVPTRQILERSVRRSQYLPKTALGLNILIFGFDSVSLLTWMRNLPKTYEYLVRTLGATVLEGYNVVGDGTPQALQPMLTGKTELELPEARRGFPGAMTMDDHPWIWTKLHEIGYVTQLGEDKPAVGTFNKRMLGFQSQPVDHYLRPYYLAAASRYYIDGPYCSGSLPSHIVMLRNLRQFVEAYPYSRKFSFLFHSVYSHDNSNLLQWADDDLRDTLEYLFTSGVLDRSLLVLMSDHGASHDLLITIGSATVNPASCVRDFVQYSNEYMALLMTSPLTLESKGPCGHEPTMVDLAPDAVFQEIRSSEQGKFEERMPFVAVRAPDWFAKRHPTAAANLRRNANRLTTPFDLHETLLDVIDFDRSRDSGTGRRPRGYSLFQDIPDDRTCADADIPPHWCACLDWKHVFANEREVKRAAHHLVATINNITSSQRSRCALLSVGDVISASRYVTSDDMLRFKRSADMDGRVPDFSDDLTATVVLYQVTLRTRPSSALYEASVEHYPDSGRYAVNTRDISRINRYGSQPHCVASQLPHLRPYCYCKQRLSTAHSTANESVFIHSPVGDKQ